MIDFHMAAAAISIAGGLAATGKYIRDTIKGKTQPHVYTWFVWATLAGIACAVSFAGGAVIGGAVLVVNTTVNFLVCALAIKYGKRKPTRADKLSLFAALSIIPIWLLTKDALLAAILVTTINAFGTIPTYRKAWEHPFEENIAVFCFYSFTSLAMVLSVTPLTFITGLYPIAVMLSNMAIALEIFVRRRIQADQVKPA